ncbi:hypothetical protein MIND_01353200 [Mycena indigotica]|uniref:DUF6533 domain-containing protein n=1 Tax=Mycena indigotica TaxID=2126181 RepID=A0A8H6RXW8_9AGAR|nr:uncharacterized protein MIND_01353200 [Mycena indigotica]KAF7289790.1 hypothetical protein MIND_01353200 [Mycena indigotica]
MLESLPEETIQTQLTSSRHLVFVPFVVILYDYLLTLDVEVSRYWGTRVTWGSALFFANRYVALLGTVPIVVEFSLTTSDPAKRQVRLITPCFAFHIYHEFFAVFSQLLVAILLITRTYALYERNKAVLALMVLVTLGALTNGLVLLLFGSSHDTLDDRLKLLGCPGATPRDAAIRSGIAWTGMLVFDVTIFLLTVFKALRHGIRGRNLFSMLLRDGAMYFAIIIAANAWNIETYITGGPIISGAVTTLTNVMSSVIISRLMLNLRDPRILSSHHRHSRTDGTSTLDVDETAAPMTTVLTMTTLDNNDTAPEFRPGRSRRSSSGRRIASVDDENSIALQTLPRGNRKATAKRDSDEDGTARPVYLTHDHDFSRSQL